MSLREGYEYNSPSVESQYRDFPFVITDPELHLEDFEIGIFTFLYFRCSDKTYFLGKGEEGKRGGLGKIAYWSYSKLHLAIGTSRTRISRTMQLFENVGLIGYISRPRNRKTEARRITYVTRTGKEGEIGSNVYASFMAPRLNQKAELSRIIADERVKLNACYNPNGTLRISNHKKKGVHRL
jgi:hypothetical protein